MKISEVRVITTCPAGQTFVVVKVLTDAGVYGVGEGTKNGRELAVAALLEHHIGPTLIGRDPGAIEDIWKFLYRGAYWRGGPIQMAALAAVDMALWDIKGKVAGLPVYSLLGGPTRSKLLTYVHTHGRDLAEAADEVQKAQALGYRVIRSQVQVPGAPGAYGAEDPDDPAYQRAKAARLPYEGTWEPEAYLRTVPKLFDYLRRTVGWDVQLLHDAHGRLTPIEAARLLRELEPYKLLYLEDPIGPEHAPSMRRVREAGTTPIAIGEIVSSRYEILPMIVEQTIDYMRCSPIHIGGITEGKKLAAIGEPYEVRTAYHGPGRRVADRGGGQRPRGHGHPELRDPGVGAPPRSGARGAHRRSVVRRRLPAAFRRPRARGGHRRGACRQVSAPAQVPPGAPPRRRQHARILRRTT